MHDTYVLMFQSIQLVISLFGLVVSLSGNISILTCPQIFIIIILKEKGMMQMSRFADVQPRKFRKKVALKRLQAYMSA